MLMSTDESSADAHPVIRGWNVPGDDGFEITGVVPKNPKLVSTARYTVRRKSRLRRAVDHLNPKRWIPHRHKISSEVFYVVKGSLDVLVGEELVRITTGDLAAVPPGVATF